LSIKKKVLRKATFVATFVLINKDLKFYITSRWLCI